MCLVEFPHHGLPGGDWGREEEREPLCALLNSEDACRLAGRERGDEWPVRGFGGEGGEPVALGWGWMGAQ